MRQKKMFNTLIIQCLFVAFVYGAVDSQWRGPDRNGKYSEKNLLKSWPADGPELLWDFEGLGDGYSSVAVTDNKIYVTGAEKGNGSLFAFDLAGTLLWKKPYGPEWTLSYPGSRSAPTVVGKHVYLVSGFGIIYCFDSNTGNKIWSVDYFKTFGGKNIEWGVAESPLVDGDRVIITPGGPNAGIAALDRLTGKVVWKSKGFSEPSAYCSPIIVNHNNNRLLLTMAYKSIVCLNADTGEYYWSHTHLTEYNINPNSPYYKNGFVYCTSGYGTGGVMLQLSNDGKSVKEIWTNTLQDSKIGAFIEHDGFIYGSGDKYRDWTCLNWKTGESTYKSRELGKGNVIFADGLLYCYSEKGEMALVKPDPEKLNVISVFRIRKGTSQHWAHPVIHDGRLYVRHGDALMVYSISQ
ncbi:PQQ-binding-like beta-propeller repeat protein [candidate division KSB1 bacterium]|nr:PQQ-binding-like beta-propeller repeat protein [candidate division KSB1 bacterium]